MDIIIYCLRDAATDWLLYGGIVFILLACTIRRLRGWQMSFRNGIKFLVPHIIICAGLVTLFEIFTGLFESHLCMTICSILDLADVVYILFACYWIVTNYELIES